MFCKRHVEGFIPKKEVKRKKKWCTHYTRSWKQLRRDRHHYELNGMVVVDNGPYDDLRRWSMAPVNRSKKDTPFMREDLEMDLTA